MPHLRPERSVTDLIIGSNLAELNVPAWRRHPSDHVVGLFVHRHLHLGSRRRRHRPLTPPVAGGGGDP